MPTLIKRIELKNFLSFGPNSPAVELGPLNVLIGPNGSGKSNLVTALGLLRNISRGFADAFVGTGGAQNLAWNRAGRGDRVQLGVIFHYAPGQPDLSYHLEFLFADGKPLVRGERIAALAVAGDPATDAVCYENANQRFRVGSPALEQAGFPDHARPKESRSNRFSAWESVFADSHEWLRLTEVNAVRARLWEMRLYRDWSFGPNSSLRESSKSDARSDYLSPQLDNLAIVLAGLKRTPAVKRKLIEMLRVFAAEFDDYDVLPEGGRLQLYLHEGDVSIPATRLSDGTLRFLCLLAILLDPAPAGLIVLEEPELGLHPDMIPTLADLLRDAATRTQVIVTTHSDILVDCFTATPEVVLVCEKRNGQTHIKPAKPSKVVDEGLGVQWLRGRIGGKRW